jgi:peptide/nickel transport system ATP-binding protein
MNAVGQDAGKAVVLDVRGLSVRYGPLVAVGGLDFSIAQGEVLGLIGESGCGKTTTAMAVLGVLPAGTEVGGVVALNGANLLGLPERELRERRGRDIALIPQGAQNSLNPVLRVSAQIKHVIQGHITQSSSRDLDGRVRELLALVALPGNVARMYPHELSGGMKQRVCVAMAVALHPRLLIADEPTSALDVVSQRLLVQATAGRRATRARRQSGRPRRPVRRRRFGRHGGRRFGRERMRVSRAVPARDADLRN